MRPRVLVLELRAFQRFPDAAANSAVHARDVPATGQHQRDRVLGDRGIAIARNSVHFNAEPFEGSNVHVARCAGAEKHDVLEAAAPCHVPSRHIGMIVKADVVSCQQSGQIAR